MRTVLFAMWALSMMCEPVPAQPHLSETCTAAMEYDPILVLNDRQTVTLRCRAATAMEVIEAAGRQTRAAVGVVTGVDRDRLTRARRSYDLQDAPLRMALQEALRDTGYRMIEEEGVIVLKADDINARQMQLLHHVYPEFKTNRREQMAFLGQHLTMWMRSLVTPACGFAGGGLSSTNELAFVLPTQEGKSTEQIANAIVELGPKGMWVFEADPGPPDGCSKDSIRIESYQHYSNRPLPAP